MEKPVFRTDLSVDEVTGKIMAVYIRVREGKVAETKEVLEGAAFADYAKDGLLLGVELISPCKVSVCDKITKKESKQVKRFVKGAMPRELVRV